jgi:glycosyltransferase involved in cell wall biosynthesis
VVATIAVSGAIVEQMNWPGAQKKMKVINPGRTIGPMYDRTEARAKIIDFNQKLTEYSEDYWAVCIAELHPIKRHTNLLRAIATIIKTQPHTRMIFIGEGKEREIIEKEIRRLELTEHVFLLGNIVEAARFLKAFDVFVLASKSESYGYVLHEAGLANVPVIATNVGGIPDIITHPDEGLLIPPNSVHALVTALTDISTHLEDSLKRAAALRAKLESRTVAKMARQTESLYST